MKYFSYLFTKSLYLFELVLVFVFQRNSSILMLISRNSVNQKIRQSAWKRMGVVLGKKVYINHSITLLTGNNSTIFIEDRVALSPNITLVTCSSPNDSKMVSDDLYASFIKEADIRIGSDSWIGAGSIIQPGVEIGKMCIIGSMSNVTKSIPDYSIAYGNPARVVSRIKHD